MLKMNNLQFLECVQNSTFPCHSPDRIKKNKRLRIRLGADASNIVSQIPPIFS